MKSTQLNVRLPSELVAELRELLAQHNDLTHYGLSMAAVLRAGAEREIERLKRRIVALESERASWALESSEVKG